MPRGEKIVFSVHYYLHLCLVISLKNFEMIKWLILTVFQRYLGLFYAKRLGDRTRERSHLHFCVIVS